MASDLHKTDFYTWTKVQADLAREKKADEIDWAGLAEELDDLGGSIEWALFSRYVILLQHLLKWRYQPEKRTRSWGNSIAIQRRAIKRLLRKNPGLKSKEPADFEDAYADARLNAIGETGLDPAMFPEAPPFSIEDAKREDFWPEG